MSCSSIAKILLWTVLIFPINLLAAGKVFLLSLPFLTIGNEGAMRAEVNVFQKGGLAIEWAEWSGQGQRQELTHWEIKRNPGSSLISEGREIGLMFSRYSKPEFMGGWNWGLGGGYRILNVRWSEMTMLNQDQPSLANYKVQARGPIFSSRAGYRYVEEDFGITVGTFIGMILFPNYVSNQSNVDSENYNRITNDRSHVLERRLAFSYKVGFEFGWAF